MLIFSTIMNNKLQNLILTLFTLSFLQSCLLYRRPNSTLLPLTEADYEQLNGYYEEKIAEKGFINLPEFLQIQYQREHLYFEAGDIVTAHLNLLSKSQLSIKMLKNDSLLSTDTLLGEIKRNYFYLDKQRYKDLSEGQFFFSIEKLKTRIGLLENRDLVVDNANQFMIRLFYIPVVIKDEHWNDLVYRRASE